MSCQPNRTIIMPQIPEGLRDDPATEQYFVELERILVEQFGGDQQVAGGLEIGGDVNIGGDLSVCGGPVDTYIVDGCGTEQKACVEANGGLAVNIQDQTSPPLLVYANQVHATTTLTAAAAIGDLDVVVASNAGLVIGNYIGIFNLPASRFYAGTILGIAGTTISLDTPLDFAYQIGDALQAGSKELNVNGSVTPQIFSLRADPGLAITADVTRIILHMTFASAGDDGDFGDIAGGILKGVVLRRVDGSTQNIFNVKTNGEIGELAYDKQYDDKAPAGLWGLTSRLTFAGQSKLGVAIRLAQDEDLQIIIQDDLTSLSSFRVMVEGHIVVGN